MNRSIPILATWFVLLGTLLPGQKPFKFFKDYQPVWSNYFPFNYNQSDVKYPFNFIYKDAIINDSKLYALYQYAPNQRCCREGGYLFCMDINTGATLWTYKYDLRTIEKNDVPTQLTFNDKGQIEIVGKTADKRINFPDLVLSCALSRRIVDAETGELLYSYMSDTSDQDIHFVHCVSDAYKLSDNRYVLIRPNQPLIAMEYQIVDSTGHKITSDTVFFDVRFDPEDISFFPSVMILSAGQDTFYHQIYYDNGLPKSSPDFDFEYFMQFYVYDNGRIRVDKKVDMKPYLDAKNDFSTMWVEYMGSKYFAVLFVNEPEPFHQTLDLLFFDRRNGSFLDKVELSSHHLQDIQVSHIKDDEFIIMGTKPIEFPNPPFRIYRKKVGQPMELLKALPPIYRQDFYFLYYADIIFLPNGDFITTGIRSFLSTKGGHRNDKYKGLLWFRFSGDEVGITGSKDLPEDTEKLSMRVYPSLAEQDLHISFSAPFTGRMIMTDLSGKEVRRWSVRHRNNVEETVSDLSPGFYILSAGSFDGSQPSVSRYFVKR